MGSRGTTSSVPRPLIYHPAIFRVFADNVSSSGHRLILLGLTADRLCCPRSTCPKVSPWERRMTPILAPLSLFLLPLNPDLSLSRGAPGLQSPSPRQLSSSFSFPGPSEDKQHQAVCTEMRTSDPFSSFPWRSNLKGLGQELGGQCADF